MNDDFLCSAGYSISVLAVALSILISNQYSVEDLTTIGSFLTALSDLILLNADIKSRCCPTEPPDTNPSPQVDSTIATEIEGTELS